MSWGWMWNGFVDEVRLMWGVHCIGQSLSFTLLICQCKLPYISPLLCRASNPPQCSTKCKVKARLVASTCHMARSILALLWVICSPPRERGLQLPS